MIHLTDDAGAIKTSYQYEPYGKTTITGEINSNPYQYTGRENDIVVPSNATTPNQTQNPTGLYFYRARYYDAGVQRFVSEDPIGFEGGDNLARYVMSNPITFHDPGGQLAIVPAIFGCGLGMFGGWEIGETIRGCFDMGWPPNPDQIENLGKQLGKAAGAAVGGAVIGRLPVGLICTGIGLGLNMKLKGPPPSFGINRGAR